MSRSPVKTTEVREMHRLAEAGLHHAAIARRLGRDRETIKRYLGQKGVFYKPSRLTADDLREWYAQPNMLAREEIAERHGYSSANSMGVVVSRTRNRLAQQGVHIETAQDRRLATARAKGLQLLGEYEARPGSVLGVEVLRRFGCSSKGAGWSAVHRAKKYLLNGARA